jgi:flagellar biogenesis protein FliO
MTEAGVTPAEQTPVDARADTLSQEALTVAPPAGPRSVGGPSPEATPLGQPNGLLSSRPADRQAKRGFSALDPRSNEITRVLGALAVVLGLLFGLRAVVRRSGWGLGAGGRPSGVIEILARYPVARGQHLILLKLARRVLLVHRSGSTMTTLSEVADPDEVAALLGRIEAGSRRGGGGGGNNGGGRFGKALQRSGAEHDRLADGAGD